MARPLRIEFEVAIYHVMSRGNARQNIVKETDEWAHLRDRLKKSSKRRKEIENMKHQLV